MVLLGGVVEHAEHQAAALRRRGHDVTILMGNDPPGKFTRFLHPRSGRHGPLPEGIVAVGRSIVVPANGSLPNIVLSPRSIGRASRAARQRAVRRHPSARADDPGGLRRGALVRAVPDRRDASRARRPRLDEAGAEVLGVPDGPDRRAHRRLADGRRSASRWIPGDYGIIPNGVLIPPDADPRDRDNTVTFMGRHEPRKGLPTLLRAWPAIRAATGARLRADGNRSTAVPAAARAASLRRGGNRRARHRHERGAHAEFARAKVSVTPALGGESFGLVLARRSHARHPSVASDIPGYAAVATPEIDTARSARGPARARGRRDRRRSPTRSGASRWARRARHALAATTPGTRSRPPRRGLRSRYGVRTDC